MNHSPPSIFVLSELFILSPDYYIQMILHVKRKINQKLFKTTQLTVADFDLHLIQDLPHLLIRNSEFFSNFEAHGTGKFSRF